MEHLKTLISFVKVAEYQSFSAAAAHLGISPAAVSKNIRNLETELGVRLFYRTTRQVTLTEIGHLLWQQCHQALSTLDSAIMQIAETKNTPKGLLKISSVVAFGQHCLIPILPAFFERYPHVDIELHFDDHITDIIKEGFDVGIRGGRMPTENHLITRKLSNVPFVVCATPAYLKKHGVPHTPEDLLTHNCLSLRFPTSGRLLKWIFSQEKHVFEMELKGQLLLNSSESLCSAALAGLGIVQLPYYIARPYIQSKQLELVLIDYLDSHSRGIYVYYANKAHLPLKTRVFIDFLTEQLKNFQDEMQIK